MNGQPVRFAQLVKHTLRPLLVIVAWAVALNLFVGLTLFPLAARADFMPEFSFVALAIPQVAVWFQFSMGVSLVHEQLRAFVTLGVSRRRFALAAATGLTISSALMAGLGLVAFWLEGRFFARQGIEHVVTGQGLFAQTGNLWLLFLEGFIGGLVFAASGLLVGWSYQFVRAPAATLMLLLTALLPLGLGFGLLSDPRFLTPIGLAGISLPIRPILALAVAAIVFVIARQLLGRLSLRPRTS